MQNTAALITTALKSSAGAGHSISGDGPISSDTISITTGMMKTDLINDDHYALRVGGAADGAAVGTAPDRVPSFSLCVRMNS